MKDAVGGGAHKEILYIRQQRKTRREGQPIIGGNTDQVTPRKIAHEKHDFHNTPPFPGAFSDFISTSGVYKTSCCSLARMLEQGTEVQMWVWNMWDSPPREAERCMGIHLEAVVSIHLIAWVLPRYPRRIHWSAVSGISRKGRSWMDIDKCDKCGKSPGCLWSLSWFAKSDPEHNHKWKPLRILFNYNGIFSLSDLLNCWTPLKGVEGTVVPCLHMFYLNSMVFMGSANSPLEQDTIFVRWCDEIVDENLFSKMKITSVKPKVVASCCNLHSVPQSKGSLFYSMTAVNYRNAHKSIHWVGCLGIGNHLDLVETAFRQTPCCISDLGLHVQFYMAQHLTDMWGNTFLLELSRMKC